MFSTLTKKAAFVPAVALIAGGLMTTTSLCAQDLQGPSTVIVVTSEYSPAQIETSNLLKEVRANAYQLAKESDWLTSLGRSNVSRQSYAVSLNQIKAHINKMGEQLAQLESMKDSAAPWQKTAIDRITPVARQLAANTEAAIQHVNQTPNQLYAPHYQNTLSAISANAHQVKNSVSDFLNLAAAQQKVDDLQMKILSSNS